MRNNKIFIVLCLSLVIVLLTGFKIIKEQETEYYRRAKDAERDIINFKHVDNIYIVDGYRCIVGVEFQVGYYIVDKNLKWEIINKNKQYGKNVRIYRED